MPAEATIIDVAGRAVVVGSREQLIYLLAEAAEIEHTLMCSYLYAAFSLKRAGEAGVSADQAKVLDRWRKTIMDVAVEEMGHLVMVANLTVAVGGRPHFGRPNFPVPAGYFPSGVSVKLSGFNAETVKHFIFLERPQDIASEDSENFIQDGYDRKQVHLGLMPSAQEYATIGGLYEAIRANLIALNHGLGEESLFLGSVESQVGGSVIGLKGVGPITNLASACEALDVIVEQGEGSSSDHETSHYRSFLSIQHELDAALEGDTDFAPAWLVADNPVLRHSPQPEGKVFIDHPDAASLLDLGCATYGMLLRCLVQCFGRSELNGETPQKILMAAAIELMHALGEVASALARLPASVKSSAVHAGMTFTMLRGIEPLLPGRVERHILQERSAALANAQCELSVQARQALKRAANLLAGLP